VRPRYSFANTRYVATPSCLQLRPSRCAFSNGFHSQEASLVRDQDPLGPDPRRVRDRARCHMGSDAMDGLAARVSGPAWGAMDGGRLYPPPAFFLWWYWFDAYAPRVFIEGAVIASSGGFAAIAISIGMSVWQAREAKETTTYGSARWATTQEIRTAGLLG